MSAMTKPAERFPSLAGRGRDSRFFARPEYTFQRTALDQTTQSRFGSGHGLPDVFFIVSEA